MAAISLGTALIGSAIAGGAAAIYSGNQNAKAIKNAIRVAIESIQTRINPRIVEELAAFYARE
jgi:fatty acid/phospholipid biosynthesis enzyme